MSEPDDIPPLEDFSSVLEKLGSLDRKTTVPSASDVCTIPEVTKEEKPETTFGGLKKGFLTKQTGTTSEPKASHSQIDLVITSDPSKQGASFQLEEMNKSVHESIQESTPSGVSSLLPENWVTDELLDKVRSNPLLAQAFEHPDFSNVLTRFTQNPNQALRDFGDVPEFRAFLQEMCSLLGHHFTKLADESGEGARPDQLDEEDRKMQEILNKDEVKEAMRDMRIRNLIMDMRDNPKRAQDTFATASPELKRKINILVKHQIIGIQK